MVRFQKQAYVVLKPNQADYEIPPQKLNEKYLKQASYKITYLENATYYLFQRLHETLLSEQPMPSKTPAIVSAVLTVLFLILFGVLFLFVQMIALNGASERQGVMAMGLSLICQGIVVILAAILAWRLADLLIQKFNWNAIVAVAIAVIAGTFGGGLLAFVSLIVAIPIAGIR